MIYGIYSIRDSLTGFMSPALDINDQSAIRNFSRAINSGEGLMDFAPKDFDLYLVGQFNNQTGVLEPVVPVQMVVSGASLFGVKYEE